MTEETDGFTRRRLVAGAGAAGVGIGLGGAGYLVGRETAEGSSHLDETVPFHSNRQAGIETPRPGPPALRRLRSHGGEGRRAARPDAGVERRGRRDDPGEDGRRRQQPAAGAAG